VSPAAALGRDPSRVLGTPRRIKGNWPNFSSTIGPQTATQTRTLDEAGGGGGCANEYERIDMSAGNFGHSLQQLTYDEAGNLVATNLLGDMNP
jgi:hypothetical protein